MHNRGESIESATFALELERTGQLERLGGYAFVAQISEATASTAAVSKLIAEVADYAARRDTIRACRAGIERTQDLTIPAATIAAEIRAELDRKCDAGPILGAGTTAANLCQNPPPVPPEVISGVLYGGGTMMLSGPSKSRKTYTFLDLGLSVSTGTKWIGFDTAKTPVIYLNFELAEHSFARRLTAICDAKGITPPSGFHSFNLRGKGVTLDKLGAELPRTIKTHGAGLVIIDPWYKISAQSGAEENSNDGQARVLAEAERIVNSNGAALVVGHHFAKGDASAKNSIDRAAGAGAMARWGDVIATLTEHEESEAMAMEFHLRDFPPVGSLCVRWCQPLWQRDDSLDPTKLKKAGRHDAHPASDLLAALRDGMTNAEWRKAIGWPDTTCRTKRDELIAAKKVRFAGGCYYRATA